MLALNPYHQVAYPSNELERNLVEGPGAFLLRALDRRRVDETPMHLFGIAGKGGAGLAHAIAHRDNVIEGLVAKLVEVLGAQPADIDAHAGHGPDGERVQPGWLAPRAPHLDAPLAQMAQDALGHLRARAVVCAEKQHPHLRFRKMRNS